MGEGEERTFYFYGVTDKAKLKEKALKKLKKLKYTGYRGSFKAFGEPYMEVGDKVRLFDPQWGRPSGDYLVKSVKFSGGKNGLRQDIELGIKISK